MINPTDKLLNGCLRNERRAQFELYHLCFGEMMRITTRYTRNREDASALVNQAFLKILTALPQYLPSMEFTPWIRTITIRTAIDAHRAKIRRPEDHYGDEWPATAEPEVLNLAVEKADIEHIERALSALDEGERLVFNLYEIEGFTHQEIAMELNCSERTCRRYLQSAKEKLRRWLLDSQNKKQAV